MARAIPILDGETWHSMNAARRDPPIVLDDIPPSEWCAAIAAPWLVGAGTADGFPALCPRVEHNRWIVSCPFCMGAQAASKTDPWFLCVDCGNSVVAGLKVPVAWPEDWLEAEQLLMRRPPMNRHWDPLLEPLTWIAAENAEQGWS